MFGYDFQADWTAIAGGKSPRVDVQSPADSLLLTHPTTDDHGGGVRFSADGWEARLLTRWIEAGAPGVEKPAKLVRVEVTPDELLFNEPGQKTQLQVVAVWADGRREDVTKLARFQTNDDAVVKVDGSGLVEVVGKGDTWVITYYDSAVIATQCFLPGFLPGLLPGDRSAPAVSGSAESPIDHFIQTKLDKLGIEPSGPASDAEFLRRVSLDIAGTLPSPEEVREFLADTNPQKRASKIDQLLASPAYAQWWSMWLSDLTGSNSQYLGTTDMNTPAAGQWNGWLRRRVQDNVGWDKIAAGILLATSRKPGQSYTDYAAEQSMHMKSKGGTDFTALDQPMHYYWFRSNNQVPSDRALSFGYVFLGVRLQCAQCHKHPFDQWSKEEFDQFTNFFDRVKIGIAPESRAEQSLLKTKLGVPKKLDTAALRRQMYLRVAAEGLPIPWNEVWIEPPRPKTAKLLGGPVIDLSQYDDPREPLVAWLTSEQNPYFAKAFVNRVWARYMGVGIVDPPDDFNRANPPSHRDLLDWLAESFIEHNYDMQWLHRTIANSEAYQRSWRPTPTNVTDRRNYSHAIVRRLPAEVTIDAILQATANSSRNRSWRNDITARKIAQHPKSIQARGIDYSLLVFGKPLRTTNCDCERQMQPTLLQSLYVRNDREMMQWLHRPDGWLQECLTAAEIDDPTDSPQGDSDSATAAHLDHIVEEAYLRCLSRLPNADERQAARRHLADVSLKDGIEELLWALLNTREFKTNH